MAYGGPRDPHSLSRHLRHKLLPAAPRRVHPFVTEQALFDRMDLLTPAGQAPKPIFVKFWEPWCTHCQALKHTFDQAALHFAPQVEFLQVECSSSDAASSFCAFNNATAFPTLILFDGESKTRFEAPERNIHTFQQFFLATLPEERFSPVQEQQLTNKRPATAAAATAAATSATPTKVAPASPSKQKLAPKREHVEAEEKEDEPPVDTPKLSTRQQRRQERRKRWKAQREAEAAAHAAARHDEL